MSTDLFNSIVSQALPLSYVKARVTNLIGQETIIVDFAIRQQWVNNIIHNDPLHMRVLVQKDKDGFSIDGDAIMPKRNLKSIGVQFRKIKGKTEDEALSKLAQWFVKNAQYLKLLGDY